MATHALFIGNNQYEDPGVRPLACAERDASELYNLFKRDLGYGEFAHLLEAPRTDDVVNRIEAIGRQVRAGDSFLLYFAGHGIEAPDGRDQYLMLAGARLRLLKPGRPGTPVGMLSVSTLVALTDEWVDVQRVMLFDACRTELEPHRGASGVPVFGSDEVLSQIAARDMAGGKRPRSHAVPGVAASLDTGCPVFIKSCQGGQLALELLHKQRSVFSLAMDEVLQRALTAQQAVVTNAGLLRAVGDRMREISRESGVDLEQRPWMNEGAPEVVLYRPDGRGSRVWQSSLGEGANTPAVPDAAPAQWTHKPVAPPAKHVGWAPGWPMVAAGVGAVALAAAFFAPWPSKTGQPGGRIISPPHSGGLNEAPELLRPPIATAPTIHLQTPSPNSESSHTQTPRGEVVQAQRSPPTGELVKAPQKSGIRDAATPAVSAAKPVTASPASRYVDYSALPVGGGPALAYTGDPSIVARLLQHVPGKNLRVFLPPFFSEGLFSQALNGDAQAVGQLRAEGRLTSVHLLRVGEPSVTVQRESELEGFTSARARVEYRVVDPATGGTTRQVSFTLIGRGFSPQKALDDLLNDVDRKAHELH